MLCLVWKGYKPLTYLIWSAGPRLMWERVAVRTSSTGSWSIFEPAKYSLVRGGNEWRNISIWHPYAIRMLSQWISSTFFFLWSVLGFCHWSITFAWMYLLKDEVGIKKPQFTEVSQKRLMMLCQYPLNGDSEQYWTITTKDCCSINVTGDSSYNYSFCTVT